MCITGKKDGVFDSSSLLLYAVTDRSWLNGKTLYEQVEAVLRGGVSMIQLREKHLAEEELLREALEIQKLCRKYNVPFLINDDVELAKEINADGVHVGQKDMQAAEARRILGPDRIIGVSARTVEQAQEAQDCGADYLGVGAVFHTGTKKDAKDISFDTLKQICASVSVPAVAIGGITADNLYKLAGSGIRGAAVVSALFAADNPEKAAELLRKECEKAVYGK